MNRFRRASRWGLLLGLVFAPFLGACVNPFKPADPELPDASSVVEDFRTPELVLETMRLGIENRSTNGSNAYLHAFAESTQTADRAFRAFYDDAVKSNWQSSTHLTAPEPWEVRLEQNVHSTISGLRPTYSYSWEWGPDNGSPSNEDPTAADTVLYHQTYLLTASPDDFATRDTIVIGIADLSFQKKEGRWSIFRWVDRVNPDIGFVPDNPDHRTMSWWRLESLTRK